MSHNNNEEEKKTPRESPIAKGWNDFVKTMKNNFETFQSSLEDQSRQNIEKWNENKKHVEKFFLDVKHNWDNKLQEWNANLTKLHIESKEQWEANKKRIETDFKNWQEKTKKDWEEGVKSWNRFWIKSSWNFLLFMLPILIVLIVIAIAITMIFNAIS
ncbi:MAG: hypothetical protein BAJALOKI3v1_210030 [Promethearchaeota archaeon]|nr:MAG: hypothetical protein BAJALOKI3v1_210030 [Candidatus Lokiarchaeota archaeon]